MKKIIHYCWFGGNPKPKKFEYYKKTWQRYLPDFEIMEWNEKNFDIHCNKFVEEAYKNKKWAFVSDVARVYALYNYGGLYMDTDVEIINNVDFLFENEISIGRESNNFLSTAMIYVNDKHNKYIKQILDFYNDLEFDEENVFRYANPKIFTKCFQKIGLKNNSDTQKLKDGVKVYAKDVLDPKSYDGKDNNFTNNTCAIHHFDATWTPTEEKISIWFVRHKMDFMVKPVYGIAGKINNLKKKSFSEKMKSLKNKFIKYIYVFWLLFFDIYTFILMKLESNNSNPSLLNKYLMIILLTNIFFILAIILINKSKKEKLNYGKIFLIFSIPIGLLYCIFVPVFAGTDEPAHFYRAYQISEGYINSHQKYDVKIPKDLYKLHYRHIAENYQKEIFFKRTNKNNKVALPMSDCASNYSPIQYIPQVIGIKLGLLLDLPATLIVILCRILSLIFYCTIIYFAINKIPKSKLLLLLIASSPAVLSLVSSCTGDTILIAASLLLISLILEYKESNEVLSKKQLSILLILCLIISLCKIVYVVMAFLLLLLNDNNFKDKKHKFIYIFLVIMLGIILDYAWSNSIAGVPTSENLQMKYIKENPFSYLYIIIRTFIDKFSYYILNLFSGSEMLYSRVRIPSIISFIYIVFVYLSIKKDKEKINGKNKFLIFLILIFLILAISTSMYTSFTIERCKIGCATVKGVQSRYFVNILPIIIIAFINNKYLDNVVSDDTIIKHSLTIDYICLLFSIMSMILSYWYLTNVIYEGVF